MLERDGKRARRGKQRGKEIVKGGRERERESIRRKSEGCEERKRVVRAKEKVKIGRQKAVSKEGEEEREGGGRRER